MRASASATGVSKRMKAAITQADVIICRYSSPSSKKCDDLGVATSFGVVFSA